jgi:hypothetical protein
MDVGEARSATEVPAVEPRILPFYRARLDTVGERRSIEGALRPCNDRTHTRKNAQCKALLQVERA